MYLSQRGLVGYMPLLPFNHRQQVPIQLRPLPLEKQL